MYITKGLKQKNVKASLIKSDFEDNKQARMYADVEFSDHCPVKTMRLYLSKIPKNCIHLFPRPKTDFKNGSWFQPKQVVGKMLLGSMMSKISKKASLSKVYTNHFVRATIVTNLSEDGFDRNEVWPMRYYRT